MSVHVLCFLASPFGGPVMPVGTISSMPMWRKCPLHLCAGPQKEDMPVFRTSWSFTGNSFFFLIFYHNSPLAPASPDKAYQPKQIDSWGEGILRMCPGASTCSEDPTPQSSLRLMSWFQSSLCCSQIIFRDLKKMWSWISNDLAFSTLKELVLKGPTTSSPSLPSMHSVTSCPSQYFLSFP